MKISKMLPDCFLKKQQNICFKKIPLGLLAPGVLAFVNTVAFTCSIKEIKLMTIGNLICIITLHIFTQCQFHLYDH